MPSLPATVTLKGIWAAMIALAFGVLLVLLGVQTVRLEGFKLWPLHSKGWIQRAGDAQNAARECNRNLAASNASIATLEKSLAAYVGAGKASQVAQAASLAAQEPRNAELQRQADAIRAEVAKGADGCETPASVRSAKGL
jgi:hypothetical protein